MDSVNKEVIQVRNSISGFIVILQISQHISSIGTIFSVFRNLDELLGLAFPPLVYS